jgi:hypothetical protein
MIYRFLFDTIWIQNSFNFLLTSIVGEGVFHSFQELLFECTKLFSEQGPKNLQSQGEFLLIIRNLPDSLYNLNTQWI